jgi:hypothetical protein
MRLRRRLAAPCWLSCQAAPPPVSALCLQSPSAADVLGYLEGKIAKWWMPEEVVFVKGAALSAICNGSCLLCVAFGRGNQQTPHGYGTCHGYWWCSSCCWFWLHLSSSYWGPA